jgi:hypothetical protein
MEECVAGGCIHLELSRTLKILYMDALGNRL